MTVLMHQGQHLDHYLCAKRRPLHANAFSITTAGAADEDVWETTPVIFHGIVVFVISSDL